MEYEACSARQGKRTHFVRCGLIGGAAFHLSRFWNQLDWLRLNVVLRPLARIFSSAPGKSADGADGHVMVTEHLTAQAHAAEAADLQHALLCGGHHFRLTGYELDSAGRATSIAATCVQLINARLIHEGQHQTLVFWNLK